VAHAESAQDCIPWPLLTTVLPVLLRHLAHTLVPLLSESTCARLDAWALFWDYFGFTCAHPICDALSLATLFPSETMSVLTTRTMLAAPPYHSHFSAAGQLARVVTACSRRVAAWCDMGIAVVTLELSEEDGQVIQTPDGCPRLLQMCAPVVDRLWQLARAWFATPVLGDTDTSAGCLCHRLWQWTLPALPRSDAMLSPMDTPLVSESTPTPAGVDWMVRAHRWCAQYAPASKGLAEEFTAGLDDDTAVVPRIHRCILLVAQVWWACCDMLLALGLAIDGQLSAIDGAFASVWHQLVRLEPGDASQLWDRLPLTVARRQSMSATTVPLARTVSAARASLRHWQAAQASLVLLALIQATLLVSVEPSLATLASWSGVAPSPTAARARRGFGKLWTMTETLLSRLAADLTHERVGHLVGHMSEWVEACQPLVIAVGTAGTTDTAVAAGTASPAGVAVATAADQAGAGQ
jgi:hypothetical protein